jgi:hypothetical protein
MKDYNKKKDLHERLDEDKLGGITMKIVDDKFFTPFQ